MVPMMLMKTMKMVPAKHRRISVQSLIPLPNLPKEANIYGILAEYLGLEGRI
jgi:hypothetical protein